MLIYIYYQNLNEISSLDVALISMSVSLPGHKRHVFYYRQPLLGGTAMTRATHWDMRTEQPDMIAISAPFRLRDDRVR